MLKKIGNSLGFIVSLITLFILLFKKDDKDCVNELKNKVNSIDKKTTEGLLKVNDVSVINTNIGHLSDDIRDHNEGQKDVNGSILLKLNNLIERVEKIEKSNSLIPADNTEVLSKIEYIFAKLKNLNKRGIDDTNSLSSMSEKIDNLMTKFNELSSQIPS